jgi:hypothetical protein
MARPNLTLSRRIPRAATENGVRTVVSNAFYGLSERVEQIARGYVPLNNAAISKYSVAARELHEKRFNLGSMS